MQHSYHHSIMSHTGVQYSIDQSNDQNKFIQ